MILSPQPSQTPAKSTEQNRTEQNEQATHHAYTVPQPTAKSTEQNRTEQNEQATHYAYTVPGMDTITLPDTTARSRVEGTTINQSINHARTRTRTRTRTYYLPALAGATPLRRDYFRVPSNRNYDSFTPTLTAHSQVNRTEQNRTERTSH